MILISILADRDLIDPYICGARARVALLNQQFHYERTDTGDRINPVHNEAPFYVCTCNVLVYDFFIFMHVYQACNQRSVSVCFSV